jgi:hypothetical protein
MSKSHKSKPVRTAIQVGTRLDRNLGAYAAVAGMAGVSLLALTQPAQGKVIYTATYKDLSPFYDLDLNHDGHIDFVFQSQGGCSERQGYSLCGASVVLGTGSGSRNNFLMGAPGFPQALKAGDKIGPAAQFGARQLVGAQFRRNFSNTTYPAVFFGPFGNGGKGVHDRYLGLKFYIGNEVHYGWARISVSVPNPKKYGFVAVVTGYAYETEANTGIIAGQENGVVETSASLENGSAVPQSSPNASLGMLARGADTLSVWRRHDKTSTQQKS